MAALNATHDPARRSWVVAANNGGDFAIQNLPFGVFHRAGEKPRGGVAVGDRILDLAAASSAKLFSGLAAEAAQAASAPALNDLMALGNRSASALREQLSELLRDGSKDRARVEKLLVPMKDATLNLPANIGAFSDFLSSIYHTSRMSGGRELPQSYKYQPIAYNSRASSLRVTPEMRRPLGEYRAADGTVKFGPEPRLDFELELAAFIGPGNPVGTSIPIARAADHIFGYCLLNDWSARGIQTWESQPLGPFLGKSFATSISPWVVTAEALAPYRAPPFPREAADPQPMPHLATEADQREGGLDLALSAYLATPKMRADGVAPARVTATNARHLYWTFAQMVTHHAGNGCNLRPGDLVASGTVSGPTDDSRACIAELNSRETTPIALPGGESRVWLEDGDEVIFRARAERAGQASIGFGECRGIVTPAET